MKASEFKAKCLKILDTLDDKGVVITKHGKAVAKLIPIKSKKNIMDYYGSMKDEIEIFGDIFSTGEKWNAES